MLLIQKNKPTLNSVGCVNLAARSIGLKLRLRTLFIILTFASGCSEFALLASGSSLAMSQNAYVKAYNGADFLTVIGTQKSIKKHVYENAIKQYKGFHFKLD